MKLLALLMIAAVFNSCDNKVKPDGKDDTGYENTGYYILVDECVKSHTETYSQYYGKNVFRKQEREVCDEYVAVKRYLDISEVKK